MCLYFKDTLNGSSALCGCCPDGPAEGGSVALLAGCPTDWDDIRCWARAKVGQVVSLSCANVSQLFANTQGR